MAEQGQGRLSSLTRFTYGLGDFYGGASIATISMLFLFFLTNIVGIRPLLAGTIVFAGRFIDAVTDPLIGFISDRTRSRWGRRSPYFLYFAVPVGFSFVLLWLRPPFATEGFIFAYYTFAYILFSIVFNSVMVPYAALAPELTTHYHERTILINTRMAFSIIGALCAAVIPKQIIDAGGGQAAGYFTMSLIFGVIFILPWLLMFFVMKGREIYQNRAHFGSLLNSISYCFKNRSFRSLVGIYLFSFIPSDILSVSFIYFLRYYLDKEHLFTPVMGLLLICAVISLPVYIMVSKRLGKRATYMRGASFWIVIMSLLFTLNPTTPVWLILIFAALMGLGLGVSYAIPWAMLPDVIDVDEAVSGLRQEGIYSGVMTFLRVGASSLAVFLIGAVLEFSGYTTTGLQPASAVTAIRMVTILGPILVLCFGLYSGWRFPITDKIYAAVKEIIELRGNNTLTQLPEGEKLRLRDALCKASGFSNLF